MTMNYSRMIHTAKTITSLEVANTATTTMEVKKAMKKTKSLLKSERMGGAAQEFFETGKDSASALCVGNDSFVSSTVLVTIAVSLPMYCTRPILAPLAGSSWLLVFQPRNESGLYCQEYFRLTIYSIFLHFLFPSDSNDLLGNRIS